MMLAAVILCVFMAAFFLSIFAAHMFLGRDEQEAERIARRLSEHRGGKTARLQLERRENLSAIPFLNVFLKTLSPFQHLQVWLSQAGLSISTSVFLLLSGLIGLSALTFSGWIRLPALFCLGAGIAGALLPFFHSAWKRKGRFKRFAASFPDAVGRMASSLRAGYSLQMALEAVAEDSGTLIAQEFRMVLAQMEVGQSFEVALQKMLERIDTPDLRLFIASVTIQRESGGNLAELLDNLEATIQDRFSLQRELESATAQAKLSGMVLSFLPVFVGFFVFLIHPDYIRFFFDDPVGKNLFWLCVAGQTAGLATIRKIVSIEM